MRIPSSGPRTVARLLILVVGVGLPLAVPGLVWGQGPRFNIGGVPAYAYQVPHATVQNPVRGAGFSYVAGYARPGAIGYFGPGDEVGAQPGFYGFGYPGYRFGPPGYRYGLPVYGDPYGTLVPPPYGGGYVYPGFAVFPGIAVPPRGYRYGGLYP